MLKQHIKRLLKKHYSLFNEYYCDVTKKWLKNATPNSNRIIFDKHFISDDGVKHPINGKEKVHPIPKVGNEYDCAKWIQKTFGGKIHIVPRITDLTNSGLSTPTPDYIWNGKKWDLKIPNNKGKFKNTLERFLKKKNAKYQAKNYIINYLQFDKKTKFEILKVIKKTLSSPSRQWVETIIVIKENQLIKVYSKK